jgi:predicted nuclease of predicted toxin-antitoxin system
MKRKIAWILLAAMTLSFAACGNKTGDSVADDGNITGESTEGVLETSKNLEGSCADILKKIYKTAKTEDDFFSYTKDYENTEITEDNEEYILGTTDIDFTDSVYSAPMMSSIAYQCVLLRVSEDQDIDTAKELLKENADPGKWVCVEAESVVVENVGDVILFIMADQDVADAAKEAFFALEK